MSAAVRIGGLPRVGRPNLINARGFRPQTLLPLFVVLPMNVLTPLFSPALSRASSALRLLKSCGGISCVALLAVTPLSTGVALAQATAPGNATVAARPAVNLGTYKLGAQDVIRVVVVEPGSNCK